MNMETKSKTPPESTLRSRVKRMGYVLRKDRAKSVNADHCGGYMIVDADMNAVVAGAKFDLTLEDVERWIEE